jgi:hypothetical protein
MGLILCSGLLLYLSVLLFILGGFAFANELWRLADKKEKPQDRLPSDDLWFLSVVCFVLGGSLLIMLH